MSATSPPTPDRLSLLTVELLDLLVIDRDAVLMKLGVQPSVVNPRALLRQFARTRPQFDIICPARMIPHAHAVHPDDHARPPLVYPSVA